MYSLSQLRPVTRDLCGALIQRPCKGSEKNFQSFLARVAHSSPIFPTCSVYSTLYLLAQRFNPSENLIDYAHGFALSDDMLFFLLHCLDQKLFRVENRHTKGCICRWHAKKSQNLANSP